jgi:hypothetical protein
LEVKREVLGLERGNVDLASDVKVVPAIIELTATSLRIGCDLSGTCRPRAFRAPPGTRRFLPPPGPPERLS